MWDHGEDWLEYGLAEGGNRRDVARWAREMIEREAAVIVREERVQEREESVQFKEEGLRRQEAGNILRPGYGYGTVRAMWRTTPAVYPPVQLVVPVEQNRALEEDSDGDLGTAIPMRARRKKGRKRGRKPGEDGE